MIRPRFAFAPVGLALVLMTTAARADVLVTLTEQGVGTTTALLSSLGGGNYAGVISEDHYTETFQSVSTDSATFLSSGTILTTTSGSGTLGALTIQVQDIVNGSYNSSNDSYTLATFGSPSTSYSVVNSSSVTTGQTGMTVSGSSQFNAANQNVAILSYTVPANSDPVTATQTVSTTSSGTNSSYNLAFAYTVGNVLGGSSGDNLGFGTMVTPTSSPSVVPEPSSFVLTGLVALGMGGVALRRRLAARSA